MNSIRKRQDQVLAWTEKNGIDVVLLQETNVANAQFPVAAFEEAGFSVAIFGEPQRDGVAIAAKGEMGNVINRLDGEPEDEQARRMALSQTRRWDVRRPIARVESGCEAEDTVDERDLAVPADGLDPKPELPLLEHPHQLEAERRPVQASWVCRGRPRAGG